jgi:hypothetical protein
MYYIVRIKNGSVQTQKCECANHLNVLAAIEKLRVETVMNSTASILYTNACFI